VGSQNLHQRVWRHCPPLPPCEAWLWMIVRHHLTRDPRTGCLTMHRHRPGSCLKGRPGRSSPDAHRFAVCVRRNLSEMRCLGYVKLMIFCIRLPVWGRGGWTPRRPRGCASSTPPPHRISSCTGAFPSPARSLQPQAMTSALNCASILTLRDMHLGHSLG